MIPTNPELRQFIVHFFSDEELETLAFDYFPEAANDFGSGMSKSRKVIALIGHCERRDRLADLHAAVARERPEAWGRQFTAPPVVETFRRNVSTITPQRDPRQIFLSHATADADFAHQLAGDLRAEGWRVWIAPESIRPGEKWVEAIDRGLETSGVFLVVLTPAAVASRWVRTETNAAVALEHKDLMRFLPLDVVECDTPLLWRQYQHIPFRNSYKVGLETLLMKLDSHKAGLSQTVEDKLRQQVRQLAALNRISQALAATLETSQVYATAIRGVDAILEVEMAAVLIVEGGKLHCQHLRHYEGAIPAHIFPSTDKGAGVLGLAWSEQETLCLNQVSADPRYDPTRDAPTGYNVRSMLATPLTVRGRPVGVLAAYNKRSGQFTDVDVDLFDTLASSVGEAIENAWLFQRVRLRHQELLELKSNIALNRDRRVHEKTGIELIRVPAGLFLYGDDKQEMELPEYWIGRTPVTNAQYKRFVDATGHQAPSHWSGQTPPANKLDHPVHRVSWNDAKAFCDWIGLHLPTEQQWEKAARGTDGRIWPWGDDLPTKSRCNFGRLIRNTTPVGKYSPSGDSPYGCVDMAGNVWEWTDSWHDTDQTCRVIRGGSWETGRNSIRVMDRFCDSPDNPDLNFIVGFRMVGPVDSGS